MVNNVNALEPYWLLADDIHVQYAVKVQRSLHVAPLSRFRGSHIPSAHEQECCRFQSYANSVRSPMKFTSAIYIV